MVKICYSYVTIYGGVTLAGGYHQLVGSMGDDRGGKYLFLLNRQGQPRWTYTASETLGNNAVSMDEAQVYFIQRTSPERIAEAKRRGERAPVSWQLVAIDATTGKVLWQTAEKIAGRTELWLAEGVLLATGGGGMTGYEASSGKLLYNRLCREGYTFRVYHPGWMRTYMRGVKGTDATLEPEEAAVPALAYFLRDRAGDLHRTDRYDEDRLVMRDYQGREWSW